MERSASASPTAARNVLIGKTPAGTAATLTNLFLFIIVIPHPVNANMLFIDNAGIGDGVPRSFINAP
jgi:hypothetical protein